ncbi:3-hydroxybutyryl-CoA dehydrogenase [Metallumcola ferriviriculae]|uniref:3-hydroxybutyryl-CoA dehydrogenase n=1 Tax=Metallumcola ferriviriculae TaxID=3039180 RepID=A0AAU0UU99_9FIRM|nr:3-hydroxybutyryl-CoA dehydrogenase [Desulfitibacteraceae bacterium MK1]
MKKVMVLGAGTMGSGIAQVVAAAGNEVVLRDISQEFVDGGLGRIDKNLARAVKKGKLTPEQKDEITGRIKGSTELQDAADADLVIEAIVENMSIKSKVFGELDGIVPDSCILASNTSALSISQLAAATKNAARVIGMHFFNPVPVMQLVEVIKGAKTSEGTYQAVTAFVDSINKKAVTVNEAPGFVVNRLLVPLINEAVFMLSEGVSTAAEIDEAMKLGANHPIGPLALADMIGLDVCLAVMETLHQEFGEDKYRPAPLLRKKVRAGELGKKTGGGFYS